MADINRQNNLGNTPLHHGFQCGTTLEIVELLLSRGANVHIRNFDGQSLFHVAAKWYHSVSEATDLLLEHGVSLKAIDDQGSSVLHEVLKNSSVTLKLIEKLLKCGAQSDHRDDNGNPPLAYCGSSNLLPDERLSAEKLLIQYSVLKKKSAISGNSDAVGDAVVCFHFSPDTEKRTEWENFRDLCIAEIVEMCKVSLEFEYTLSEFLYDSVFKKARSLNLSELEIILTYLQKNKFPVYKEMLICAVEKYDFENFTKDLIWFATKTISHKRRAVVLTNDCIKEIIKFLSKHELINLILAYCKF